MSSHPAAAAAAATVPVHRGCLAGLGDTERQERVAAFKERAATASLQAAAQELERYAIAHAPEDRFSYMLMERSVEELRVMAADYGVQNAERLGHGDLVAFICAAAANDVRDCELAAETADEEQYATLLVALDADGRIEFERDRADEHARLRPFAPYTFLYTSEDRFTLLVTDVFKENFAAMDRKAIERRRARRKNIVDSASGLVELYGIVEAHVAHELYNSWFKADALGFGEYARLIIREAASQRFSFVCWSDGHKDYLVHYTLLGIAQQRTSQQREVLEMACKRIIEAHERVPMRELGREVVCGDVYAWKRSLPVSRELRAYLDAHVPEGENDYVFADRTIDELLFSLAATPDMGTALEVLGEAGLAAATSDERLRKLVERFVAKLPCWDLNGWSRAEKGL